MVDVEVPPWIKGLPVAPEYRPSEAEFVDPVSFVLRIEEEASQYGICKIVPPTPKPPRKAILPYLQQSIAAAHQGKNRPINRLGVVKFATRRQGLGGDGAAPPGGSGGSYSLDQFEAKSKAFSKGMVGTSRDVVPVVLEAMFWKKIEDAEAVSVEVSEKIPGSAFPENAEDQRQGGGERVKRKKIKTSPFDREGWKLVNSAWNLRYLAGLPGSMARFVEDEVVEGVTAPLLYVSMLFSRWEWKIDENDLHLVEHLHLGGPKTWYVVPAAAGVAFEDLMRKQDQNSIVSPEVLVLNGVPCCRLVQNPGEYVIVFPRAYHFSLTHSFTCGETSSLATPAWLNAAKQAAARRDFVSRPPIVCHEKLLYQTALAFAESSHTQDIRSSRLKHKMKAGAEEATRTEFVKDFLKNQHILDKLVSTAQARRVMLKSVANPASSDGEKENICKLVNLDAIDSISLLSFVCETMEGGDGKDVSGDRVPGADEGNDAHRIDWGNVSCSVCGIKCYSCVVILQPTSKASENIQAGMVTSSQADTGLRRCHRSQNGSIGTNTKKRNAIKSDNQMHPCIVCPEHGLQLSMLLQECGGCFVLVVHHPDYETFDKHAKDFATELNKRVRSGDPAYDQVTEQDLQLISTATNEERDTGWIARVESSLPKVCLSSESSSDSDSDDSEISAQKEKKVLGRWCGRVWRHDQTHAALGGSKSAPKIEDDPEENINNTRNRNASDEETAGRSDDCASIRTNCRKRKRTQMTAIWRVESERARVKSEGLTDQFEVKVIEPGEERSSEGLRALPGLVCKEETGSDVKSEMLEPIGHGDISEPRVILDCNGAVRNETLVDCKEESETRHRTDIATNSALDTEVISASRDEKSKNKQIQLVEKPSSVRIDPRVSRRSTRCCSNSNSIIWFDVPISFSPTFRSSYMKRSPTAAYRSPVTTSGIPKRKRTRAVSAMEDRPEEDKEHKKEATDEDRECDGEDGGDEAEDPIENDTPAPAPARTRFRTRARTRASALASVSVSAPAPASVSASVSVSASASFLEDDAVDDETVIESRTKRTKRKSWKAMAAEDEQQARALRKGAAAKTSSASSEEDVKPTEMAMIRRHACDLDGCTMSFGSAAELSLHKRNICTVKECSKRLCSHSYLAQHYRVHGDERPLACPWQGCGKTFKWAWARTEHVRVHTGARPYACADCGKSYRFVSDFSRHKRTTGHRS